MENSFWDGLRTNKDSLLVLAAFVSPLIALVVGLGAQLIIIKARRKESLDEWWYSQSVENGIEPVLNYMSALQTRFTRHLGYTHVADLPPYPVEAINHLKVITTIKMLDWLLLNAADVDEYGVPDEYLQDFTSSMAHVQSVLIETTMIMLDIKLKSKQDKYSVRSNPKLLEKSAAINKYINDMPGVPDDKFPDNIKSRRKERYDNLMEDIRKRVM